MSRNSLRYIPTAPAREAMPVLELARPQLAARIHTLRKALDDLRGQEQLDGGMPLDCIGAMKRSLIALEMELFRRDHPQEPPHSPAEPPMPLPVALAAVTATPSPYAPTERQIAFYQRLAASPCFSEEERQRALEWLATKATRQTIKDQIDWLRGQVQGRQPAGVR